MTYQEALAYIHDTNKFGSKLGLEPITELLNRCGNPQKDLKFVHVAGTNGKGSSSSMIHEVLSMAGYKVGLYTSPYIEVFEERMRINGVYISQEDLSHLTEKVKNVIDEMVRDGQSHPTEFEVVTAIAMLYFKSHQCDLVVLEVGLGGRLDATNVIDPPLLSVITPIDLDHMAYLGDSLSKVAFEKAGIIKKGSLTLSQVQHPDAAAVIKKRCEEEEQLCLWVDEKALKLHDADLNGIRFEYKGERYELSFLAKYQMYNAALAIDALELLKKHFNFSFTDEVLKSGLKKTQWMGRMEKLSAEPVFVIDGAHNAHGIGGLVNTLTPWTETYEVMAILGVLEDKDVKGMIAAVEPLIPKFILTEPDIYRALCPTKLAAHMDPEKVFAVEKKVNEAVKKAWLWASEKPQKRMVIGFGSLYMLGDIRRAMRAIQGNQEN